MREAEVLKQVLAYLTLARVPHWRCNVGGCRIGGRFVRFGVPGLADVVGLLPPHGRFLAVEVKRPGGRVSPAQRAFLSAVEEAGGFGFVVHSVDDLVAGLALARREGGRG